MDMRSHELVTAVEEIEQESESRSSGKTRKSSGAAATDASSARFSEPGNKFVIRLPAGLRKKILLISRRHRRSMNSEIVLLLGRYFEEQLGDDAESDNQDLETRLRRKLEGIPSEKRDALLALLE